MNRLLLLAAVAALCGNVFTAPIPLTTDKWDTNPLAMKFRGGEIRCSLSNINAFAETLLPCGKRATVSAKFRVENVVGDGWSTVGVALVDDAANFWHLALVQAPKDKNRGHFFELCEMRDSQWLAQENLKVAFNETSAAWQNGRTYSFVLALDPEGITGEVKDEAGKSIFRKRYLFSAEAVRAGRPALHATGGFQGAFITVDADSSDPVEKKVQNVIPPYQSDSFVKGVKGPAAGFFRVQQNPDGRWWVIDPLGRGVVLMGVDHVTFWGHWCEKLQKQPHFEKNKLKYASKAQWEEETLGRLKSWGFNFLGAGCDPALKHRGLIHTVFLSFGDTLAYSDEEYYITPNEHRPCSGFPNVFHPDFEAWCQYSARINCAPNKDDPWLFGYFIDNELAWWGRGALGTGLFDAVMKKAPTHTAKTALRDFLAARANNDVAVFNKCWGTAIKSFDDVLTLTDLPQKTAEQEAAKEAFLRLAAERYFSVSAAAIRKADPNHLVMGARFAGVGGAHPIVWETAGKYCDLVTFNVYPWADIDEGVVYMNKGRSGERAADCFTRYYNYVKKPMLITEWSFPALDAGLPSRNGAGQRFRTQEGRTAATKLFAETMLSMPFLLGYDYFMWVDEPALGISTAFPEDSNYGLVNEDCVPYPLITKMFTELQKNAGARRFQPLPAPKKVVHREVPDAQTCVDRIAASVKADTKAVEFVREGDAFRLTNADGLELSGKIGDYHLVTSMTWHGKSFGAYNAMVRVYGNRWLDATKLTDVKFRSESGRGVLELTGAYQGDAAFEITHRLTVFQDRPVVMCEFVRVANKAVAPLKLLAFYFRLYAPFKDLPQTDVPNLWEARPGACWLDKNNGRYIGFVTPKLSDADLYFWLSPEGGTHPDARYEFGEPITIEPGKTYTAERPMFMACTLGDGGTNGWEVASSALSKQMDK
jgi:hypothetical protein